MLDVILETIKAKVSEHKVLAASFGTVFAMLLAFFLFGHKSLSLRWKPKALCLSLVASWQAAVQSRSKAKRRAASLKRQVAK